MSQMVIVMFGALTAFGNLIETQSSAGATLEAGSAGLHSVT